MTFTYLLSTDVGQVRLEIGDVDSASGRGVKPDGTNLSDEELQVFLDREGVGKVLTAAAAACETLARHWARVADITLGPRRESLSQVSRAWSAQAQRLREQYGGAAAGAFAVMPDRTDGYSEHADDPSASSG